VVKSLLPLGQQEKKQEKDSVFPKMYSWHFGEGFDPYVEIKFKDD